MGAVDYSHAVAPFSSEGPSQWTDVAEYNDYPYTAGSTTEIGLIRPDICAPGVQIKSLDFLDALAAVSAVDYDGIGETVLEAQVFPNPSSGDFTVVVNGMTAIAVFSVEGRLLKAITVNGNQCRVEGLSSGVYVLRIETDSGLIVRKIVKL